MVIPLGLSDHYMVGCVKKLNSMKGKPRIIICQNYSRYTVLRLLFRKLKIHRGRKSYQAVMLIMQFLIFDEQRRSQKAPLAKLSGTPGKIRQQHIALFLSLNTDYFAQINHTYQTRRNRVHLIAPKISTEMAKKSMYYKGAIDFHSVPSDVKHISLLFLFKSKLLDIL